MFSSKPKVVKCWKSKYLFYDFGKIAWMVYRVKKKNWNEENIACCVCEKIKGQPFWSSFIAEICSQIQWDGWQILIHICRSLEWLICKSSNRNVLCLGAQQKSLRDNPHLALSANTAALDIVSVVGEYCSRKHLLIKEADKNMFTALSNAREKIVYTWKLNVTKQL